MTNGNSKFNLEALKTLGLIIGLLIIIAQGLMSSGTTRRSGDEVKERVARLEECVMSLRPLPQEVAGMKATLNAIKEKIDAHVAEK